MSNTGTISLDGDVPWGAIRPAYWNGDNYFATSNGEKICLVKLDSSLKMHKTVVGCPGMLPRHLLNCAFPCVQPGSSTSIGKAYFFFPGTYADRSTGCVYYLTASDSKPRLLGGNKDFFASPDEALSCSITSSPYGLTLVTLRKAAGGGQSFHCSFVKWSDIKAGAEITGTDIAVPSGLGGKIQWTDAMYTLGPADNGVSDQSTVLLICAPIMGSGSTWKSVGVLLGEVVVDTAGETPTIDYGSITWRIRDVPEYSANKGPLCSSMNMGIDGRVYNVITDWWTTPNKNKQMNPELWRRDGPGQWTNLGFIKQMTGVGGIPGIAYVPGTSRETPSAANPELDDALTPVERYFLYPGAMSDMPTMKKFTYWGDDFGHLQRSALEKVPGMQKLLFGIIEGPPPIPNENINIPNSQDPSLQAMGMTIFSDSEASSEGYNISVKAGLVYQAKAEAGLGSIDKATASVEMSAGYQYSEQHQTTTTSGVSYSCEVRLEQDAATQQWKVQPIGAAILLGMDMTGFTYRYLEPDGSVAANAPVYSQIFAAEITVTTYPYVMNPETGPTPGELMSYVVPPDQLNYLQQNASFTITTDGKPTPNLVTAWGLGTKTATTWQKYESEQYSNGFYFDLKAMIGVKYDEQWIQAESSAGVQFHMEGDWTNGSSSTIGLSTQVSTRGNVAAVGTYSYYDFYTFQLNPAYRWAQEFLDNLVTDTWPKSSFERDMNQKLKDVIATLVPDLNGGKPHGPAPWKICYALGNYQFIMPVSAAAERQGVSLTPALSAKLDAAGIHTTAQLQQLLQTSGEESGGDPPAAALTARSDVSFTEAEIQLLDRILRPA